MNFPPDGIRVVVNDQVFMVYRCGNVYRLMKNGDWRLVHNVVNDGRGYNCIKCNGKMKYRHRIIAYAYLNLDIDDPTSIIDHRNGNRIDNRVDNLYVGSQQDNTCNRRTAKGYYWNKPTNKWKAQIKVNYKVIYLGRFNLEADARAAYLAAKLIYHPTAPVYDA